jgi:hypothetical protein
MLAVNVENALAELHRTPTAGVFLQNVPSERECCGRLLRE